MYFITTKRMLEVCFSAHPNIQYRTFFLCAFHKFFSIFSHSKFLFAQLPNKLEITACSYIKEGMDYPVRHLQFFYKP